MEPLPRPGAVIFMGSPGSGKGTQANTFADVRSQYYHFDTGAEMRAIFKDPHNLEDPEIRDNYERIQRGELSDPSWATKVVRRGIERIAGAGKGIVFSGSPRTLPEAESIIPFLMDIYGKDSLVVMKLSVSPEVSRGRNAKRRVCKVCARPIPSSLLVTCPHCGGEVEVRKDDAEEVFKTRLTQYEERTRPILEYYQKIQLRIFEVNGEQAPHQVATEIRKLIDQNFS